MKTTDGILYVVGGASRSGKTAWVKRKIKGAKRVLAWDPEDQWAQEPGFVRVTNGIQLIELLQRKGPLKVAFVSGGDLAEAFNFWAGVAQYANRYIEPLEIIAEELSDVSTPAKAPGNWGILIRRGLKRGSTIYAISQRWQEADKTAIGNASLFVFFRQNGRRAVKYLEDQTGIPAEVIPTEPLNFVVFDPTTGKITKDRLRF